MFSDWLKRGCSDIILLQQWADVMIDFEWDEWFLISGSRLFVRSERAPDEYIWFYSLRLVSLTPMKKNLSVQIKKSIAAVFYFSHCRTSWLTFVSVYFLEIYKFGGDTHDYLEK